MIAYLEKSYIFVGLWDFLSTVRVVHN